MSRLSLHAVLILAFVGLASAQDASVQPQPAEAARQIAQTRVSLAVTPSMAPIAQAISASGMNYFKAVLVLDYDADGVPVNLALDPRSGNEELDRAIIAWGREARVTPGKSGTGRLPFSMMSDQESDSSKHQEGIPEIRGEDYARKPSLRPVLRELVRAKLTSVETELFVEYDDKGRVTDARLIKASGDPSVDASMLTWAQRLRLKAGVAGFGRIPMLINDKK